MSKAIVNEQPILKVIATTKEFGDDSIKSYHLTDGKKVIIAPNLKPEEKLSNGSIIQIKKFSNVKSVIIDGLAYVYHI